MHPFLSNIARSRGAGEHANQCRGSGLSLEERIATGSEAILPHYKKVSRSLCELLRLTWEKSWTGVVRRCDTHPEESFCVSEDTGRSALHLASFNQACPQFVALTLIRANPYALILEDPKLGWTPLHHLCAFSGGTDNLVPLYCSEIQELERDLPNGCTPQPKNLSPLCLACQRNAPTITVDALLTARRCSPWIGRVTGGEAYYHCDPNETAPLSPLRELAERNSHDLLNANEVTLRKMKAMTIETFGLSKDLNDLAIAHTDDSEFPLKTVSLWEKCMLLLCEGSRENAYRLSDGTVSPAHIACSLAIPCLTIAKICFDMFHGLSMERDSQGLIPLHHVVLHNSYDTPALLDLVLSRAPASAYIALPDGSSPLVACLRKSISWDQGLATVVRAAPDTLEMRDSSTNLFPCLSAASWEADLTTIYQLVRFAPAFARQCHA